MFSIRWAIVAIVALAALSSLSAFFGDRGGSKRKGSKGGKGSNRRKAVIDTPAVAIPENVRKGVVYGFIMDAKNAFSEAHRPGTQPGERMALLATARANIRVARKTAARMNLRSVDRISGIDTDALERNVDAAFEAAASGASTSFGGPEPASVASPASTTDPRPPGGSQNTSPVTRSLM